jgi:hypothetical protein
MVWSVRNVVTSGLLQTLAGAGLDVRLLVAAAPGSGDAEAREAMRAAGGVEELRRPQARELRGRSVLQAVRASCFARVRAIGSYGLYSRWFRRNDRGWQKLRSGLVELSGRVAASAGLDSRLSRAAEGAYRRSHDLGAVHAHLDALELDALWSTVCVSALEYPYVLAARQRGLPVVTSVLSFDNLTSRGEIPPFDRYLVWNARMRAQLCRLYPDIPEEAVVETGTPQFDFHVRPEFRPDRAATLQRLGLPPSSRYLLYAASHVSLTPEEPELVAAILRRREQEPALRDQWAVIRLHPLDDGSRWSALTQAHPKSVLARAWSRETAADGWTYPTRADLAALVGTILHSDACLNVASTMALDAALLDRPAIGIDLSAEPAAPRGILYAEYGADHYRPLTESGGIRVARSFAEIVAALREAVETPQARREARARMVASEIGRADGHAGDRVAAQIEGFVRGAQGARYRKAG